MVMQIGSNPRSNLCPVCGFQMEEPPIGYNICPCCGTEFELHTAYTNIIDLRRNWINNGARWWSISDPIPRGWNPYLQMFNANLETSSISWLNMLKVTIPTRFSSVPKTQVPVGEIGYYEEELVA